MKVEVGIQIDKLPRTCKYGCDLIEGNDMTTKFYVYMLIFNFTAPYVPRFRKSKSKLTLRDELLMVIMQLRLVADLCYQFEISNSTVTTVFLQWIEVLYGRLKFLVMWPSQEILQHNIPQIFKKTFPSTRCIIHCFEIFMERPYSFESRA